MTEMESMTVLSKTEKGNALSLGKCMKPASCVPASKRSVKRIMAERISFLETKVMEKKKENWAGGKSFLTNQVEAESLRKYSFHLGGTFDGAYVQSSSEEVMNCILCCFLFLLDREFDKDTMVQLWVAEGIFEKKSRGRMEEFLGGLIFNLMVDKKFILPCRFDNIYSHLKYRLNKNIFPEFPPGRVLPPDYRLHEEQYKGNQVDYLIVEETKLDRISNGVKHLSLICEAFNLQTSEVLKSFKSLRTLILFCAHGTAINHVPSGVFHHLKQLRTLDMQGFNISHLPGTVGDLESLRYLDVSETQIKYLPESMGSLNLLQALKLKGCLELHRLPKRTKDLILLRHLDLDIVGQLKSMPSGIGSLTNLQTLRAFLIGKEDGCGIAELKNLANLSGSICISRLENVLNSEDARGAELSNKKHLSKLTFQWDSHYHDQVEEEDILEGLQPHSGIKELEILFFHGSKLPTWISNSSFLGITNILLFKCRNCSQLPSLGRLPSLKFLEIYEMNAIKSIDHLFCGNDTSQEHHAFPKLEKLTLDFMLNLEEWIGVEDGDFPSLLELRLKHCPKLFSLSLLLHLHSLRYLEIIGCTEFQSLPDSGIPLSVQTMVLKDCPGAKERCANSDSQDWHKIAHIPSVFLDYEEIFPNKQANKIACIPSVDPNRPEFASPYEGI